MRIIRENKLLDPKNDTVFQELFGRQKNAEITRTFISLVLGKEIKNIDLDVNKRMLGNNPKSKTGRLDIRAKFNDGEDVDIELQVQPYKHMDKRMLEYWGSMYTSKIVKGDDYDVLKPSIVILIADYKLDMLKNINDYHMQWKIIDTKYREIVLTDALEIHTLELPKIKTSNIDIDKLALWLRFIQDPSNMEVQEKVEEEENKVLKQAMNELAHLSGTPGFRRLVEAREGFIRDQNTEKIVAKREGKKEKSIEIAKKLLLKNMDIKEISEITELSIDEIEKLKANIV